MQEELAQLRFALQAAQERATQWESLAMIAGGCIRKAMLQLTDAKEVLGC